MYNEIDAALRANLPKELVDRLIEHHKSMKAACLSLDWEKALLRGGKFAEVVMKLVHFKRTGNVIDKISVDEEIKHVENSHTLPVELCVLVPRHIRPIYDHRNKRGGGHDGFEPSEMDARVSESIADWVLSELLRLFGGLTSTEALRLVRAVISRRIPLVEEIDGDLVLLAKGATARQEVGVLLYARHPQRQTRKTLISASTHTANAVRVAFARMDGDREIHESKDGIILTSGGLNRVESYLNDTFSEE